MPLRSQLESQPETLSDFDLAAEQKFWEGTELGVQGHRGSAIYLLGYAAEMWLKRACFRFDGASLLDRVQPRLVPARIWLARRGVAINHESYHSLTFWMTYLRERRAAARKKLANALDGELVHRVRRLYAVWWVEMRYRPDQASLHDLHRAYDETSWLRRHAAVL